MPPCAAHLSAEQVEELGRELDAIRQRHLDDRGETDRRYITAMVRLQKALEIGGRGLLFAGFFPPALIGGAAALGLSKILDNMEIGHNIMHGQYDWMEDPRLHSSAYEWDNAAPASQWKHGHNVVHHTYTNVVGKDRDVGYALLRVSELQPWSPRDLGNPLYMAILGLMFQYGVALHELEVERLTSGDKPMDDAKPILAAIRAKAGAQAKKDYLLFPLLAGPVAPFVIAGNIAANLMRNVWAFTVIFCGHFPEGVEMFSEEDIEGETRARWYLRQMLGSANLTGGPVFHVLTGNLSFQIEHHLFPDLPAWRYAAIAADVRELADRYDLPYNTGPLHHQFGTVIKRVVRLSVPNEFPGQVRRFAARVTGRTSETIDALAEVGAQARIARDGTDLAA
ncbi:fatty acid desaturase [Nitriliruptor sp.]|uniref:fatty acid desaturase n=1 Tax=Nitriliruptor sp. TaxID=2448056 RepID=UPI0034A08C9B